MVLEIDIHSASSNYFDRAFLRNESAAILCVNERRGFRRIAFVLPPVLAIEMIFPVGFSFVCRNGKVLAHGVRTHSQIVVRRVPAKEIRSTYLIDPRLGSFAAWYCLSLKSAKNVLEANGVGFLAQLRREFSDDASLNQLATRHGPKPETLSNWIAGADEPIKRGNHRRGIDIEKLVRVFRETSSVNRAAEEAGVHWSTAADRLKSVGAM